jgi:hypothetical protein
MNEPISFVDAETFNTKMQAHYAAVGKVASHWAEFEHRIQWTIWAIAALDNLTGACITAQIGNSGRLLDALIALLRLKRATEASITPLRKFAERVGNRQRDRNRVVHDPWCFAPNSEAARSELSAKKEVISNLVFHSTEKVDALAHSIIAMIGEFESLLEAVKSAPREQLASNAAIDPPA